jgi:chitinase
MMFSLGGIGEIDLSRSGHGNPAYSTSSVNVIKSHSLEAGPTGDSMTFEPYWKLDFMLAAFKGTEGGSGAESGPYFDGKLSARVESQFADYQVNFPPDPADEDGSRNVKRNKNAIEIDPKTNVIYNTAGSGGRLAISAILTFGLKVNFNLWGDRRHTTVNLTDVSDNCRLSTSQSQVEHKS